MIKSIHAVVPAPTLTPYPLICLTDLWGVFLLFYLPVFLGGGFLFCFVFVCFFFFCYFVLLFFLFCFFFWTNPLAVPASFVEFSLTDPFHRLLMMRLSGFTAEAETVRRCLSGLQAVSPPLKAAVHSKDIS